MWLFWIVRACVWVCVAPASQCRVLASAYVQASRACLYLCVCAAVSNSALTAVGQSQPGCDLSVYLSTFNLSFCFTLFLPFQSFSSAACLVPQPLCCSLYSSLLSALLDFLFLLSCILPPLSPLNALLISPSVLLQNPFFKLHPYLEFGLVLHLSCSFFK